jgi:hypothetical protein
MIPLLLGIIILVAALAYHIIYNKEGFESSNAFDEYNEILIETAKKMPKEEVLKFAYAINEADSEKDSAIKLLKTFDSFEYFRPYYTNTKYTFDEFILYMLDLSLIESLNEYDSITQIEADVFLAELKNRKAAAKAMTEMPSEKAIKDKLKASADKTSGAYKTTSDIQGRSCKRASSCPNVCESDEYIRKDSIPCWNCNLPRN